MTDVNNSLNVDNGIPSDYQTLIDYNDSITKIRNTRADLSWRDWAKVGIKDAIYAYRGGKLGGKIGAVFGPHGSTAGAIIGGVVIGGAASYFQYQKCVDKNAFCPFYLSNPTDSLDNGPTLEAPPAQISFESCFVDAQSEEFAEEFNWGIANGLDSCSVKVAIQHNYLLESIESKGAEELEEDVLNLLSAPERYVVESSEFKALYDECAEEPSYQDFDEHTDADFIMDLFIEAIEETCLCQDDVNEIVSFYTSFVRNNEDLENDEKDCLCAAFAVMSYSFKYWSENWPYDENWPYEE